MNTQAPPTRAQLVGLVAQLRGLLYTVRIAHDSNSLLPDMREIDRLLEATSWIPYADGDLSEDGGFDCSWAGARATRDGRDISVDALIPFDLEEFADALRPDLPVQPDRKPQAEQLVHAIGGALGVDTGLCPDAVFDEAVTAASQVLAINELLAELAAQQRFAVEELGRVGCRIEAEVFDELLSEGELPEEPA